jgi:inosose dehydratase
MDQGTVDVVNGIAVGTASVNWGFDPLYTWVRPPQFEQMLDEMAQAGYAGTEISYHFPADANALKAALAQRSLAAAATFVALDLRDSAHHEQALQSLMPVADRLQTLGADTIILSDRPSPPRLAVAGRVAADGSDGLDEREWHDLGRGLDRAAELLAQRSMRAVFHPHVGTYVETRAEIDLLCSMTDARLVGLCPDTGHLAYAGVDAGALFRDYAPRIRYVHLKDVDGEKLEHVRARHIGFVEAVRMGLFVELGTGMVDVLHILDGLRRESYEGWIIVEQDAPADPLKAATNNRRFLRKACGI